MGVPVITNSVGAEGLYVCYGRELLIAETPEDIARAVAFLFENPQVGQEIGDNAQKYAQEHNDWNVVFKTFKMMNL